MKTPEQKNYLGYFRGIGILIFLMFSFFVFGTDSANAFNKDCVAERGALPAGQRYALFILTEPNSVESKIIPVFDEVGNPSKVQREGCVIVQEADNTTVFMSLVRSGVIDGEWQDNDAEYVPGYVLDRLGQKRFRLEQGAQGAHSYYRINKTDSPIALADYVFLFFVGFFDEPMPAPNSVAWRFKGVQTIKALVRVNHGETGVTTLGVNAIDPNDAPVQVTCARCAELGAQVRLAGEELTVTFDTKRVVDVLKPELPVDVEFVLKATVGQGAIKKYSNFRLTLHINPFDCSQFNRNKSDCDRNNKCFWFAPDNQCASRTDPTICPKLSQILCGRQSDGRAVGSEICTWATSPDGTINQCVGPTVSSTIDTFEKPPGYQGPIPDCAWSGSCRDVNALLQVLLNYGQKIFGMIGMLAFVMFIIGGFMMIFSMGSPDRVKKGRDILVAAVVGMIIMFSAYILVNFLLDALGVGEGFRAIQ